MDKKVLFILILIFILTFLFLSCSSTGLKDQLHFGITAAQNELWEEAIFRWKKVIQNNPQSAAAHNNLAVAYEKKGWWEKAEKEYKTALELDPDNSYIQSNYQKFKNRYPSEKKENEKK